MELRATTTGADLEKLTAQTTKALKAAQRPLGREIARAARRAILADVRRRRRGGLGFSGMGTRLGASTKIQPGVQLTVTVAAKPAGAWSIVEHGSKPHVIRVRRAQALHFDGFYAMSADHPGTLGHAYWAGAETALDDAVIPVIDDAIEEIFEEAS
jgi:hypothetical protein